MKKQLLSIALISAFSSAAYAAAPSAELIVTGTLASPTCTVNPPNDGKYDYGRQSNTLIKPNATVDLPKRTQNWHVHCDADTYLTYKIVDNKAPSSTSATNTAFGLGFLEDGTNKIGSYTVMMKNATVTPLATGVSVPARVFATGAATFNTYTEVQLNETLTMGWASTTSTLLAGSDFFMDLEVAPTIASSGSMGGVLTQDEDLDGSLTLNFAFSI